jgi:hypothetical protein
MQPWRVAFAAALIPQHESSAELMHFMTLRTQSDTELYKEQVKIFNCRLTLSWCNGREAAEYQDLVVLPNIQESYFNITHQTLEMCRMAAMDPAVTHLLKVDDDSYVHVTKLMARLKALPREKMFAGYMEKTGEPPLLQSSCRRPCNTACAS